ncbi:hypothetical protein K438DRAFT_1254826 [Mycena galopus ATCC 62051]|nr:hypothetical protein K438DRAFT_1254826 [Mycena galopus ATCC 62051]
MYIGYDGKEITISEGFFMLIGPQSAIRWVPVSGRFSLSQLAGAIPVRGGAEAAYGEHFYVAQGEITTGGILPGKVKANSYALIPYAGTEQIVESYNVLVFA